KVNPVLAPLKTWYTGLASTNTTLMGSASTRQDGLLYSNFKFLWPIPASETTLNPTLASQQNPGW
ncbi:MAG TPA: hypothetical protein VF473_08315, partial [Cyclobacteriaceae bacterium]